MSGAITPLSISLNGVVFNENTKELIRGSYLEVCWAIRPTDCTLLYCHKCCTSRSGWYALQTSGTDPSIRNICQKFWFLIPSAFMVARTALETEHWSEMFNVGLKFWDRFSVASLAQEFPLAASSWTLEVSTNPLCTHRAPAWRSVYTQPTPDISLTW
jgi:hypothetical protein